MKHKHHIIPRHMGGSDDPSNLIELTVEEHAEAHKKLWEEHGKKEDWIAWQSLSGLSTKEQIVKELLSLAGKKGGSISRPPKNHKANLGRKWSDEYKLKMSILSKGITKSQEHKNKISIGNSRSWKITTPDGNILTITNLETFCKSNNLLSSKMSLVASGKRKHHKGYLCEKLG